MSAFRESLSTGERVESLTVKNIILFCKSRGLCWLWHAFLLAPLKHNCPFYTVSVLHCVRFSGNTPLCINCIRSTTRWCGGHLCNCIHLVTSIKNTHLSNIPLKCVYLLIAFLLEWLSSIESSRVVCFLIWLCGVYVKIEQARV